jgi:hypothetical protein
MVVELRGTIREEVEQLLLAALWHGKTVRLTAEHRDGQYVAQLHTLGGEPDTAAVPTS